MQTSKLSKWPLAALLIATSVTVRAQTPVPTGTIAGTVSDERGKPIPDVFVSYLRAPDLKVSDSLTVSGGAISTGNGDFAFDKLPAGTYLLCATAPPQLSLLDICEWTMTPPSVTLADGQVVTGVALRMTAGLNLQFRIDDPKGLLANPFIQRLGALLLAGVWDDHGFFHAVRLRSFDTSGQDLALAVPFAQSFRLNLSSTNIVIRDTTTGQVLSQSGTNIVFDALKIMKNQQYQFSVDAAP